MITRMNNCLKFIRGKKFVKKSYDYGFYQRNYYFTPDEIIIEDIRHEDKAVLCDKMRLAPLK